MYINIYKYIGSRFTCDRSCIYTLRFGRVFAWRCFCSMYVSSTLIFMTNKEGLIWKTVCVLSEHQTI